MKTVNIIEKKKQDYFTKEAYTTLRTNLLFSGTDVKAIAVTSCMMHEGKSTVTLALAKSFSELGKRVLLIDADLRKSVLTTHVEGAVSHGLSTYLSGQVKKCDVIHKTQYPTLDIIFAGRFPPNPVELLDSSKMRELMEEARSEYDIVLIDTPPLGMVVDCAVVAPLCDGTVFVLKANEVHARDVMSIVKDLREKGCTVLGAVLNHVTLEKSAKTQVANFFINGFSKTKRFFCKLFSRSSRKKAEEQPLKEEEPAVEPVEVPKAEAEAHLTEPEEKPKKKRGRKPKALPEEDLAQK